MTRFIYERGALPGDAAYFSADGKYRYIIERGVGGPVLGVIMLNPSTADAHENDPTIRKVLGFAQRWRYSRVRVVNLFAYRATDPRELRWTDDPIGPKNDDAISSVMDDASLVVAAWGADRCGVIGKVMGRRIDKVIEMAEQMKIELWCFRETSKGAPEHPLYVPYAPAPVRWRKCPHLGTRN